MSILIEYSGRHRVPKSMESVSLCHQFDSDAQSVIFRVQRLTEGFDLQNFQCRLLLSGSEYADRLTLEPKAMSGESIDYEWIVPAGVAVSDQPVRFQLLFEQDAVKLHFDQDVFGVTGSIDVNESIENYYPDFLNKLDAFEEQLGSHGTSLESHGTQLATQGETLSGHVGNAEIHVAPGEKSRWDSASNGISAHTSNAEVHTTAAEKAAWNQGGTGLATHVADTTLHLSGAERTLWNSTATNFSAHAADTAAHPTAAEKAKWSAYPIPNVLLNSDFNINQRKGTSYTNNYGFDRWYASSGLTMTREANNSPAPAAYHAALTGTGTFAQPVEDYATKCVNKQMACSVWLKASANMDVSLRLGSNAQNCAVTTNWQLFTAVITPNSVGDFTQKGFNLYKGTAGTLYVSAPQLVFGPYIGGYQPPDPAGELLRCKRYYETSGDQPVLGVSIRSLRDSTATRYPYIVGRFEAEKRVVPAISYKSECGFSNEITVIAYGTTNGIAERGVSAKGFWVLCKSTIYEVGTYCSVHYFADAEIRG